MRAGALLLGAALWSSVGCRAQARLPAAAAPEVAGGTWGSWRTLAAEHKVVVTTTGEGNHQRRALRGVIAVERPGSFRLRALGPAGITLFDVLYRDGRTQILGRLADAAGPDSPALLSAVAADLAAAYDLAPRPPERTVSLRGAEVVVEEPERTVRLRAFAKAGHGPAPSRMSIVDRAGRFAVEVEAEGTVLDEALDPALFAP